MIQCRINQLYQLLWKLINMKIKYWFIPLLCVYYLFIYKIKFIKFIKFFCI